MGYTNQFNLEVGATLNTTNIPKKINELNAQLQKSTSTKIEVPIVVSTKTVDVKDEFGKVIGQIEKPVLTAVKNIYKEVNIYKDKLGNTFKEIKHLDADGNIVEKVTDKMGTVREFNNELIQTSSALKTLTTETRKFVNTKGEINEWTTSVDNMGKTVQTRTKQYVNDSNELITETSEWGKNAKGQWTQLGDTVQKTSEIIRESTTSTNTTKGAIEDLGHTYQGLITTTEKVSSNGEYLKTVISKYTDEMGRAVVKTEQFDKMGNQVATTMRKIGEATKVKDTKTSTFVDEKGVKTVTQYVDGIATAKTVTSEYKNKLGELVTEIKKYEIEQDNLGKTQERLVSINTKTKQSLIDERKEKAKLLNETTKLIDEKNKLKQAQERLNKALVSTTTNKSRGKVTQFGDTSGKEYDAIITKIGQIDASGKITIKTIQEFTNSLGQLVQQIRVTDENDKKLVEDSISISNAFDKENEKIRQQQQEHERLIQETANLIIKKNELKQAQDQLNKALTSTTTTTSKGFVTEFGDTSGRQYEALITTIREVDSTGKVTIKTVQEFTNAQGRLVQQTRVTDENLKKLVADNKTVSDTAKNSVSNIKNLNSGLNNLSNSASKANYGVKNLGWTLGDAISRLSNFYIASLPIRAVQTAISETITTVKEFDDALIEFRKVSDLAGESLTNYVAKLAEMGEVTGSTMQAMVEASTEFRKSGFTDEDSAKLASIAEKYRNIADEEISAGESASFIIAQMKAFNIEANDAEHIIDSVNEVANNFSVSSADLAKNLGNMSAIMAINNVSMEEQIGMLTGVTEITRNASSASRGLVMISSRLTQVLDSTSSTGKKLTKIYGDLGIALKDSDGQLRSHYDILGDLAVKWDSLSENEQKYIALTSAGARQQQNFVSLMENWNQVANATATAYESMGSAQKENEKVMDSVSKKVEILHSQFQQLVIGNGGLQKIAKGFLDLSILILKFANSDIGKGIIATTSLMIAINLLEKSVVKLGTSIMAKGIAAITQLTLEEAYASLGTISFTTAIKACTAALLDLATAILTNPLFWIGAVIIGAKLIFDKLVVTIEESAEQLEEFKNEANQAEQELERLKAQLDNVNDSIARLNSQGHLSVADEHELELLKEQSEELRHQISLQQQKLDLAKQNAEASAKVNANTSGVEISPTFSTTQSGALKFYTDQIEELTKKQKKLEEQGKQNTKEYQNLINKIDETKQKGSELALALESDVEALVSEDAETKKLKKSLEGLIDTWLRFTDKDYTYKKDLEKQLDEFSKGGNVDLKLRPVINTAELNKQGYDAGQGFATIFSHTFTNESNDLAVNFTPIMVDPNTGEYLGVMAKDEFEQYCEDVVNGVHEDTKNLQIGVGFKKEDYDDFVQAADDAAQKEHELSEAYVIATGAAEDAIRVIESYDEAVDEFGESSEEAKDVLKEFAKNLGISEEELVANAEAMHLSIDDFYEYAEAVKSAQDSIKETSDVIDGLQDALTKAQTALDEYNQYGYLTIDTFQNLMSVSAQYLTSLINEEGQLEINEQTLNDLVNQVKQNKIEELQLAEINDILAYAFGDVDKMSSLAKTSISNAGDSAKTAGSKAQEGSGGFWSLAEAISAANAAAQGDVLDATHVEANIQKIHSAYSKLAKSINTAKVNTTKAGNAAKTAGRKGAGAAKEANDATKELNKTLEETKKKYETVISWIKKQYDKKTDAIKDTKDAATDAIEKEIKALEKEKDSIIDGLKDKKDALEKEKDTILDGIETEIKALEDSKDARKKYWDKQIDALKKANDARKDAIELQEKLDALERARNTKVKIYKEGQGFVFDVDQTKVAEAQKALDKYLSEKAYEDELKRLEALKDAELDNFEKRIDALNKFKDKRQKALEDEIDALDDYIDELEKHYDEEIDILNERKNAVEEQYDAEIEMYENYKQQFEDMVNAYEEQQNKLLAQQLTGIDFENDNWMTRLDNLAAFVNEYNKLQAQLDTGNTDVSNNASMSSGTGSGGGGGYSPSSSSSYDPKTANGGYNPKGSTYVPTTVNSSNSKASSFVNSKQKQTAAMKTKATFAKLKIILGSHASGVDSIKEDEIAVVGENPNKEIVIGSKVNNGELMSLNKGAGVVNADSSNTLAGMLNQVGKFGSSGFGSGNGTLNNNINNDSLVVNGVTIEGSKINDPQTFVNGLLNLKAEALQRAYRRS